MGATVYLVVFFLPLAGAFIAAAVITRKAVKIYQEAAFMAARAANMHTSAENALRTTEALLGWAREQVK